VPEPFWRQPFSGARAILVSALFWWHFSGARAFLMSALFWCQSLSGVSAFLVSAFLWCQSPFGVSTFLVPERLWRQHFSGTRAGGLARHTFLLAIVIPAQQLLHVTRQTFPSFSRTAPPCDCCT